MPTAWIEEALTIECPLCHAGRGEYCTSKHAISIHQARRDKLRGLEAEATRLIRRGRRNRG